MGFRRTILLAAAALSLAAGSGARANPYTFTNVANDAGPFKGFFTPQLNNNGVVLIQARFDTNDEILFTDLDGVRTTIVQLPYGPHNRFFGSPAINDNGVAAFVIESYSDPQVGVFTGSGGAITTIAHSSQMPIGPELGAITNAGTVAFHAHLWGAGERAILAGNGAPLTTIANTFGPLLELGLPTVNESGTVAFGAIRDDGTRALYTAPVGGGTLTLLYDSTGSFSTVGTGGLFGNINNRGTVLFRGELDAGGEGLFLGNGGPVTRVADTSGAYGALFYGRINAAGQTAFRAALDGGGEGIFFGADPATDKVIAAGDVLFGSTVAGIENLGGLNDAGQLVFEYTLANGISGVALATPVPEPTTAGAIVLGALVTAARRRRATSHQPGLVRRDV